LALFDPGSTVWKDLAPGLVTLLMWEDGHSILYWSDLLTPIRSELVPPLRKVFSQQQESEHGHKAALLLADYVADEPRTLVDLILEADPRQLGELLPKDPEDRSRFIVLIRDALAREKPTSAKQSALDHSSQRKANAAMSLAALGEDAPMWPLLAH